MFLRSASFLAFALLAGCLDGQAPTATTPPTTSTAPDLGEVYVVAADAGANPDGLYSMRPAEQGARTNEPTNVVLKGAVGNLASHTLVIDEFDLKLGPVGSGASVNETVTFDRAGTFAFYCDVGNHRQLGMEGTLTVSG